MHDHEPQPFRSAFPVCDSQAYFQWAYRGALPALSLVRLTEIHAAHSLGGASERPKWFAEYERVGNLLCQMLHAEYRLTTYTPNTSFAMGMVANGLKWQEGDEVLIPEGEFPANVYPWMALERFGVTTRVVKADGTGKVSAERLASEIRDHTKLVAASHVSFHNGYRMDVAALAKACREAEVWSVIDAAQSVGWAELNVAKIDADVVTGVGRKFLCALDGLGFMFLSERLNQELGVANPGPFSVKHQSNYLHHQLDFREEAWRLASGGIASPQVFALGVSLELFQSVGGFSAIEAETLVLAQMLREGLESIGVEASGAAWKKEEQSAIIQIPNLSADRLGLLSDSGVSVSIRDGGIRVALHAMNSPEDIAQLLDLLG